MGVVGSAGLVLVELLNGCSLTMVSSAFFHAVPVYFRLGFDGCKMVMQTQGCFCFVSFGG